MIAPENENEEINSEQDETTAQHADINSEAMPADDGFKTGNKSNGLTWENPMDEQSFEKEDNEE